MASALPCRVGSWDCFLFETVFLDNWPSGHPHRTSHIWVPGRPSEIKATGLILAAPSIEWRGHGLEEMWTQFHDSRVLGWQGKFAARPCGKQIVFFGFCGRSPVWEASANYWTHQLSRISRTANKSGESIATSHSAKVTNFKTLWVSICLQNVRLTPYKQILWNAWKRLLHFKIKQKNF